MEIEFGDEVGAFADLFLDDVEVEFDGLEDFVVR